MKKWAEISLWSTTTWMCFPSECNTSYKVLQRLLNYKEGFHQWNGELGMVFFLILGHLDLFCHVLYSTSNEKLQILARKGVRVEILCCSWKSNYIYAEHSLGYVVSIYSHHQCFSLVYKISVIALTVTCSYYIISA